MLDTIKRIESLTKNLDNPENRRTLMREYGDEWETVFERTYRKYLNLAEVE